MIKHVNNPQFDWDMMQLSINRVGLVMKFETTDRLNRLDEQLDCKLRILEIKMHIRQQRLRAECLGKILTLKE